VVSKTSDTRRTSSRSFTARQGTVRRKTSSLSTAQAEFPIIRGKGWNFTVDERLFYKHPIDLASTRQFLNQFDLVIWTVPVPPKNKLHMGNDKWPDLYALEPEVRQVAFIHDGNARNNSNHILQIAEHLNGVACVHDCALNGANFIPVPRALVVNPQYEPRRPHYDWDAKVPGFISMQTFKAWKRVHDLVKAIRFMPPKRSAEYREVAGKGIEYQYMTSVDKCKEAYYHEDGERIWDAALENGMTHWDYWDTNEAAKWLDSARVLVDPSYSKRYASIGGHWNRVAVDAMIHGAIPAARPEFMGSSLFKAGEHFYPLPDGSDPQEYADAVLEAGNLPASAAARYRDAAWELLPMFDRKAVAQRVINLARGELSTRTGNPDATIRKRFEDTMIQHYGVFPA
jgi:glycosyltransferase involved in cell wall biosynthesis